MLRHCTHHESRALTRNCARHELLPLLAREFNPEVAAVLGRYAQEAAYRIEVAQAAAPGAEAARPG
jgi:hypothetical protein